MNTAIALFCVLQVACLSGETGVTGAATKLKKPQDFFGSELEVRLARAIQAANCEKIRDVFGEGANLDAVGREGMRPLFFAMVKKKPVAFRCLLDLGADPNVEIPAEFASRSGDSIMKWAALYKDTTYLEPALQHGGNPDFRSGKRSTIMFAAIRANRLDSVRMLAKSGADVNHVAGRITPLITASNVNNWDMVHLLLLEGADPNLPGEGKGSFVQALRMFADRGLSPKDPQYTWLLKVIDILKERGLIRPEESVEDWR